MRKAITKAVIPAAGLGTRFLPATKALPKEMLPVVDKPAIQYVVEESVAAGLVDILVVTGRNKHALANHFDRVTELEATLESKGEGSKLRMVNEATGLADLHYVRQGDPRGLGHAVLRAKNHVGEQAFAVMLGDDLIDATEDLLSRMLAVAEETGGSVIALQEIAPENIHKYGVASVAASAVGDDDIVQIVDLIEKPSAEEAPSNLAVIGRYVLQPEIFTAIEETEPGRGGEIQLTDALQKLAKHPEIANGVYGVIYRGRHFDTGDKLEYIKAIIQLASDREDLGPELRPWLKQYAATLDDDAAASGVVEGQ